ncbi:amylo-alpha-1,6-glucosidase [Cnuibacter physcomitrellae]|uniref:glycogen debranching N-terminal domain-containing protein n=1 Tax=Cnuibacter physcomitrellae TaxID=1619308 RepID=UPI002175E4A5|nr:glycogen debranching N-terminal domain-containing protein [Cnuibacter physcomitrellae]MCS5496313.1 amylo-alpha-1,6-glucosidase [Cnuibacter physcomitrellae]
MTADRQPLLHDSVVALAAPTQAWSAADGRMHAPIHGIYHSETRVIRGLDLTVEGEPLESLSSAVRGATQVSFSGLARGIDDGSADPRVRLDVVRTTEPGAVSDAVVLSTALAEPLTTTLRIVLTPDFQELPVVKSGRGGGGDAFFVEESDDDGGVHLAGGTVSAAVSATVGAGVSASPEVLVDDATGDIHLVWQVTLPPRGSAELGWRIEMHDAAAVVGPARGHAEWRDASVLADDSRLTRWAERALDDLDALRMTTAARPDDTFLAAGAPWFFTLFGRDSLWAARLLLPFGTELAASTLRVLASMQGTVTDPETAEQPGKIMHELRPSTLEIPGEGISLPPLYFGTIDATPLWIVLLHDAWRWGMPDDEVRALLPTLLAALEWMRDHGDSDEDGFLEYVDLTGHGLANQGWKDSGDSVQWRDGTLATGPIALCEVQGYAYEAAVGAAALLEHLGEPGADGWRAWAADLADRFRASFWVESPIGRYPAIALDAEKRPVDTLTSNIGHLLGTGLLSAGEEEEIARLLVSPLMSSGFGLRTMSTDSGGYWPLSYHGGSVWAHDTAIAVSGLSRAGFAAEAATLGRGLLAAAEAFAYRMPELHSGDSALVTPAPAPYPAACRPQAWSAAAAVAVAAASVGLRAPETPGAAPSVRGLADPSLGGVSLSGIRSAGRPFRVTAVPSAAPTVEPL